MIIKTGSDVSNLLATRSSQILELAEKHGAYNLRALGSAARGEVTDSSDIDLLVDYDLGKFTPWFPSGLLLDSEQLLNRKVDIATVDMMKERFRDRILQEAKPL